MRLLLALLAICSSAFADGAIRTVLVIDASSSMKRTDPKKLRKVAANLFVDLARTGDQIAVTGFDEAARQSTNKFFTITDAASRRLVKDAIDAVGNDGKWTDFSAGLNEAKKLFENYPSKSDERSLVVFLTDGRCEPAPASPLGQLGKNKKERTAACLDEVTKRIVPALGDVRLYPVGLSKNAPKDALREMARRSGGTSRITERAEKLPELFAGIYAEWLGSKLFQSPALKSVTFEVYGGAATVDIVVVGKVSQTAMVTSPTGATIPIHNNSANVYFAGENEYRLFKVQNPPAGIWKVDWPSRSKKRLAVLQHFDLKLKLRSTPDILELPYKIPISVTLESDSGFAPAPSFLKRHVVTALLSNGKEEKSCELKFTGTKYFGNCANLGLGDNQLKLSLVPGPDGVLSRVTDVVHTIKIVPEIAFYSKKNIDLGDVKQGSARQSATLDMSPSKFGIPMMARLQLDGGQGIKLSPSQLQVSSSSKIHELAFEVGRNASPGRRKMSLKVSPVGIPDRSIEVPVSINIVELTFWERHGTKILVALGTLFFLFLLAGMLLPAKFKRRTILYYLDNRDPDTASRSSYPIGTKSKRGFYKSAKLQIGYRGPVRKGGLVEIAAHKGNAIVARPISGEAVYKVPSDFEGRSISDEEKQKVTMSQGTFRMASGARYQLGDAGLVFWV